ncbi:hypothetical protein [Caballeronia sp. LZ035]|uniref:hypothetical protein n=1 Tax=Caballeronia sp. LZ035 TaxID=3038568 RepID=UPI00285A110E|nr:hypothetical protein [Caballeronia sp. LZ035]MDR5763020.1 hypothetical protein [Caballeronia sp. LZ035]
MVDLVAFVVGVGLGDFFGVDHEGAMLAFTDVRAERLCLLERYPTVGLEAFLSGSPQRSRMSVP